MSQTNIDTAAVSNALTSDLSLASMANVVTALAAAANQADVANKTELENIIGSMKKEVEAAKLAADRLEHYELGQVEAVIQQLVDSEGFQSLLQSASVTINGSPRSLESVLNEIISAPRVEAWDFQRDAAGDISGVIATLSDGSAANMQMSKMVVNEGEAGEFDRYTFGSADFAGKGFPASFDVDLVKRDIDFGGLLGLGSMGFGADIKRQSNLVFDINGEAPEEKPPVSAPDANNDGVIGNKPDTEVDPLPMAPVEMPTIAPTA